MRITFVIYSLGRGGAQRVMSIATDHLAKAGWRVTLLSYDSARAVRAFKLNELVDYRPLGLASRSTGLRTAISKNIRRLSALRRALRESDPDVVVSFLDVVNVRSILASLGLGIPVIVAEQTDPVRKSINRVWRILRHLTYRFAAMVIVLTPEALSYFPAHIRRKGRVIPNPLPMELARPPKGGEARRKSIMGMGRLVHVKGFDRLLRAFALLSDEYAEWSVVIWGEGELRSELENLRDKLGLRHRVTFPGWTDEPYEEMKKVSIFVVSSRFEGFSMVLCEAMSVGVPVVSFDCPSGPRHIIRDGVDGVLVPANDVQALSLAIEALMGDEGRREQLGASARGVVERFGTERVMALWEDAIKDAIGPRDGANCG